MRFPLALRMGGEGICRLSWQHACSTSVGCPFNSIAKPLRKKFQIPSFSPSNPTVSRTRFLWFPSQGPRVFACWFAIAGREWSVPWIFPIPRKLFPQPWLIRKRVLAKPQERPLVSLLVRLSFMAKMDAKESWNGAPTDCSIRVTCPPQASAGALFDSLFKKSYSCQSGRLLSITDKTTPAPQPLHFNTDDNHGAEVYLDGPDVKYAGDISIDESAKPLFEAFRVLYQCKNQFAGQY